MTINNKYSFELRWDYFNAQYSYYKEKEKIIEKYLSKDPKNEELKELLKLNKNINFYYREKCRLITSKQDGYERRIPSIDICLNKDIKRFEELMWEF